ncbi:hypothetical protein MRB53_039032 [Persea americana]|nr:hypothetical protein MRB53_039032 [Persea americana]
MLLLLFRWRLSCQSEVAPRHCLCRGCPASRAIVTTSSWPVFERSKHHDIADVTLDVEVRTRTNQWKFKMPLSREES